MSVTSNAIFELEKAAESFKAHLRERLRFCDIDVSINHNEFTVIATISVAAAGDTLRLSERFGPSLVDMLQEDGFAEHLARHFARSLGEYYFFRK